MRKESGPSSLIRKTAAVLVAIGALAACGDDNQAVSPKAKAEAICIEANRNPLPSPANVDSYEDTRHGDILPCLYLLDMGIPINTATPLVQLKEHVFSSSEFHSRANFGGFLFFGFGEVKGSSNSIEKTKRKDVYAMQAIDENGDYRKVLVDAEKVSLRPCSEDCPPTLTIEVTPSVLFKKGGEDNSSIWVSDAPIDENQSGGWKRFNTVAAVSHQLPREEVVGNIYSDGSVTGGPRTPGEVISALASRVIISLPKSMIENPSPISE